MPKPTREDRRVHRQFLLRQKKYEAKFVRVFLSILSKQYREAATAYPEPYRVNPNDYKKAIENVYLTCLPAEAQIAWDYYVVPLTSDRKDFFDDLAELLGFTVPNGEHIRMWRSISQEWLSVNILTKITGIAQTTQRAIAKVIQRGIDEGLSANDISKEIRKESNGEINKNRSVLIARTETIMASNKGRRLSMYTSNLLWGKKWVDTADERTRTSHRRVANENYRPLDEPYMLDIIVRRQVVGQEPAECPGDPKLSAGNICNCRCCETYEVLRDAQGRPRRKRDVPLQVSQLAELI